MASGLFITPDMVESELSVGVLRWISRPGMTDSKYLIVIEQTLKKNEGPVFHCHPRQEEMILVTEGTVEQWLGEEKRTMNVGDYAFMPAGLVHRTVNVSDPIARLLIMSAPVFAEFENGVEFLDVSGEAPWNSLE